ncbi:DMT family transporter [Aliiglaciecola sp. LCG003]|nr:DMT family transporter [Aliiglaciecola sp. LCG003]WJG10996.1 DMT family transporter [Aliiglaciecola sp. LCG003]
MSLITAVLWGVLPIFLQISLQVLDSPSITWIRFLFAAIFVFILLLSQRKLPIILQPLSKTQVILLVAALALVANYVANVKSLVYVNPETVQVVMQVAPLMLMLGGIVFFKERFNRVEMLGVMLLVGGLTMFFSPNLGLITNTSSDYAIGVFLIIFAAGAWAAYALLQKVLLKTYSSKQLTLLIYCLGVITLLPFVELTGLQNISPVQLFALIFCCLNTVIAYGCFTEALNIWSASKVSAVVATGPLFTFLSMHIAQRLYPDKFAMIPLSAVVVGGALCVVMGSITIALAKQKPRI